LRFIFKHSGEFHARAGEPNVSSWTAESSIEDTCKIGGRRSRKVQPEFRWRTVSGLVFKGCGFRVNFIATNCQMKSYDTSTLVRSNLLNRLALQLGADSAAGNCTCATATSCKILP
jgi:hypothetical protein